MILDVILNTLSMSDILIEEYFITLSHQIILAIGIHQLKNAQMEMFNGKKETMRCVFLQYSRAFFHKYQLLSF